MAETSPKQLALKPIEDLPADATIEDAMQRLYFLAKIQRGPDEAGRVRTSASRTASSPRTRAAPRARR